MFLEIPDQAAARHSHWMSTFIGWPGVVFLISTSCALAPGQ